ncbi:MAG: cation:dicarboxylase symporter family transporter [Bacteroidales bacterium]|jgi:proton glutamate symport protein
MKKSTQGIYIGFFVALFLTILLHYFSFYKVLSVPKFWLIISRWLVLLFVILYSFGKKSLTVWILISMLAGIEFGFDFPVVAQKLDILSNIFLRMIKTIIAPLLFGTLVVGIAGHPNLKQVGRMGWKSILYFEIITTIALFIGLAAINISRAGYGIHLPADITQNAMKIPEKQTFNDVILHIFPENIAKSIAEGNILQVVIFSVFFGIAIAMVKEKFRNPMIVFAESLSEVMFKFTKIIMYFAPVAVFAALAYTVGNMGLNVMISLLRLLATLYIALFFFVIAVLVPVCIIFRIPVKGFFKAILEPASIAFATTSSEAALPVAMKNMELFGVPRKIVSFVLPLGYTFNLDGSTLYLSLASVFVAQAAGINMPLGMQLLMMLTLLLTSKGVAGVPRAAMVILLGTAASFGLPALPIFILLGIDALMDMARTMINVVGNSLASVVIAKWEGEFNNDHNQNNLTKRAF